MADQHADAFPVTFADERVATVLRAGGSTRPAALVERLGLTAGVPVIVVIGGGDSLGPDLVPRLSELFVDGLVRAADDLAAVVVDGGTESGIMAVTGQAVAGGDHRTVLVGVAPAAKVALPGSPGDGASDGDGDGDGEAVPLEPNHSHFVLAEGADWGGETKTMFALADGLAAGPGQAVGILVGGGPVARREVLEVVRRDWPLVVITGTGGIADEIVASRGKRPAAKAAASHPELAEIVAEGCFDLVPLDVEPAVLAGVVRRRLSRDETLEAAWDLHAGLDQGATRRQREFRRMQGLILGLGVLATLLAVTEGALDAHRALQHQWLRERALRYALLLIPIAMTGVVGASARFRAGHKWVVLRGAAEAVRREIFRYRTRSGPYGPSARTPREVRLAERIGTISSSVMTTDVNLAAIEPYDGPLPPAGSVARGDDGFSGLSAEQYIRWRLQDQAGWYRRKTVTLERRMRRLRWAGIGFGGLGTFLAAVGFELWIAVTTAVVAALTTYLEYTQLESTLLHYNQASANLETIRRWWVALPDEDRFRRRYVSRLVEQSERVLQSESSGWVQDMHDAMTELRSQQERSDDADGASPDDAPERRGPAGRPDGQASRTAAASRSARAEGGRPAP